MESIEWDTSLSVELDEVEAFITSDTFTQFLLNNTTSFEVAAFVLDAVLKGLDRAKEGIY